MLFGFPVGNCQLFLHLIDLQAIYYFFHICHPLFIHRVFRRVIYCFLFIDLLSPTYQADSQRRKVKYSTPKEPRSYRLWNKEKGEMIQKNIVQWGPHLQQMTLRERRGRQKGSPNTLFQMESCCTAGTDGRRIWGCWVMPAWRSCYGNPGTLLTLRPMLLHKVFFLATKSVLEKGSFAMMMRCDLNLGWCNVHLNFVLLSVMMTLVFF